MRSCDIFCYACLNKLLNIQIAGHLRRNDVDVASLLLGVAISDWGNATTNHVKITHMEMELQKYLDHLKNYSRGENDNRTNWNA